MRAIMTASASKPESIFFTTNVSLIFTQNRILYNIFKKYKILNTINVQIKFHDFQKEILD
ncbi:hypothetical protein CHL76_16370 [Marinococcus halophilus]|uniref:Uncharacterized protein n=1 Tax=Marinococcus halophilus TaxID=1371 RepID=A0A510YA90_MARHA|nr:hypothetical protein CHL76_16370 [Marinococcus halophilus]GEK60295.1 hypothetical protein MHA01_32000 [Marinococcus halophilus]